MQRQTFRFFWDGAHQASGCARDRQKTTGDPANDLVAVGGTGFGVMAIIVAVERGWISRARRSSGLGPSCRSWNGPSATMAPFRISWMA